MIPAFPEFKPLEIADRDEIYARVGEFPPYSDFNFVSLFCWNKGDIYISDLQNNLVIQMGDYCNSEKKVLTFLGKNEISETIHVLFQYVEDHQDDISLEMIPGVILEDITFEDTYLRIQPQHHHADYIYDVSLVASLKGRKYKKKRSAANIFNEQYSGRYRLFFEQVLDSDRWKDSLDLLERWAKIKKDSGVFSQEEYDAFVRFEQAHPSSEFVYCYLYVDSKLEGLCIFELVHDKYAISHFKKTNKAYVGLAEKLFQQSAQYLLDSGISYINMMQDLNDEGLRKNKRSWRPVHMLTKYAISKEEDVL